MNLTIPQNFHELVSVVDVDSKAPVVVEPRTDCVQRRGAVRGLYVNATACPQMDAVAYSASA